MEKTTCVFGDLTALYSARSNDRKQINYKLLDEIIKVEIGVSKFDENMFYTLFSNQNEKQISFINGLKEIGWNIETMDPKLVPRDMEWSKYRFDPRIAYQLSLGGDRLVLVTDSFELYPVIEKIKEDEPNTEFNLMFFSSSLDSRWWKVLNSKDPIVNFIDLDEKLY